MNEEIDDRDKQVAQSSFDWLLPLPRIQTDWFDIKAGDHATPSAAINTSQERYSISAKLGFPVSSGTLCWI